MALSLVIGAQGEGHPTGVEVGGNNGILWKTVIDGLPQIIANYECLVSPSQRHKGIGRYTAASYVQEDRVLSLLSQSQELTIRRQPREPQPMWQIQRIRPSPR